MDDGPSVSDVLVSAPHEIALARLTLSGGSLRFLKDVSLNG
jgi:hypothetical protein